MTVLRLDPAHPPLWRSVRSLQFGVPPVTHLDDPAPWQERLVHELERGLPADAAAVLASSDGVAAAEVRAFLDTLRPALRPAPEGGPRRVVLEAAADDATAGIVRDALAAAGCDVDVVDGRDRVPSLDDRTLPRVLLAHHALSPDRAAAAMRDDAPHLPLVLSGRSAEVGPLIVPGRTACAACLHAHRRDADPAWPLLFAQLLGRAPAAPPAALATEAAQVAARLIRGQGPRASARGAARSHGHSVTLSADSTRRTWTRRGPHPECACRSLPGSATAPAVSAPDRATMRSTAYAQPA